MALSECVGQCEGHLCLSLHDFRLHFHYESRHLLLLSNGHRTSLFRTRLGYPLISFCLIRLEFGPNVLTYIDIRDINRQNLKGRTRVEPLRENHLRDRIRILEHIRMCSC